jgi:hypothetical protein
MPATAPPCLFEEANFLFSAVRDNRVLFVRWLLSLHKTQNEAWMLSPGLDVVTDVVTAGMAWSAKQRALDSTRTGTLDINVSGECLQKLIFSNIIIKHHLHTSSANYVRHSWLPTFF